jgi:hypothetical protein
MINKIKSDFLVSTPSFASGAGRLLDWYGLYDGYNVSRSGREADAKAMFADWRVVGEDINDAMSEVELETARPVK